MKLSVEIPARPAELIEIEGRRAAIRREAQAVKTELQRLQDKQWNSTHGDENLDRAAEAMAAGETDATSRDMTPERIEELRSRLNIIERANEKLTLRVAREREKYHRSIASVLRPEHKKVTQRIARALAELVNANAEEEMLRAKAPGNHLPPMNFPNTGKFGPGGGPAAYWRAYAKRLGYLLDEDEPEATWPAAAL